MLDDLINFGTIRPRYFVVDRDDVITPRIRKTLSTLRWIELSEAERTVFVADLLIYVKKGPTSQVSIDPSIIVGSVDDAAPEDIPVDMNIDSACSDGTLRAMLDAWRPTSDVANFQRTADAFGTQPLLKVARGFVRELSVAIDSMDKGDFTAAHRIGGLAGTLGFRRASEAWLRIDEGDVSDLAGARREARLAQAAVSRWLVR